MNDTSFIGLVQNAALLLAVAFIFDLVASRWRTRQSPFWQAIVGLALGTIGITVMLTPWTFGPGIVFDTRSVLIGISGLFFGSVSTAIAMAMTALFRFYQGGTGVWTGIAVILTSGAIGIAWRYFHHRPQTDISWRELYLFGIVIHLSMLGLMLTLPWEIAMRVLSSISLPVMLIYPLGTALLGVLMVNRLQREQADEGIRVRERSYRTLAENLPGIVYRVHIHEKDGMQFFNSMLLPLTGYNEEELTKGEICSIDPLIVAEDRDRIISEVKAAIKDNRSFVVEYRITHKNGTLRFFVERGRPIFDNDGLFCIDGIILDITPRKQAEEALRESENRYRELSIIDDLTQLYNSRYFYDQLKKEIGRVNRYEAQYLTLLLLDLDDFKQFNDAYGHVEGDQVLSRLGEVVKRCLRQTDSAYRYGGEEFTILLPMTTTKDASVTAERIRTEFKKENFHPAPDQDIHVTVSIGLAQYKAQEDMKVFVNRVDQLMYHAKNKGKDMVCSE